MQKEADVLHSAYSRLVFTLKVYVQNITIEIEYADHKPLTHDKLQSEFIVQEVAKGLVF